MRRRTHHILLVGIVAAMFAGCGETAEDPVTQPETPLDDVEWMMAHAPDYLHDRAWRRNELEKSLWKPELPYARKRLDAYALEEGGWDLLPEMNFRVEPVHAGADDDDRSFEGQPLAPSDIPETREEWLELGEKAFWSMPMRRDSYLEWLIDRPEHQEEVGLQTREDGTLRGVVRFRDARGDVRKGITCGFCHGDGGLAGRASRTMDLGRARDLFGKAHGVDNSDYASWGPGRIDITDDGISDPLAIPDLWGTSHHGFMNSSGAIQIASPAAVAIRFETQYIEGTSMEARPNRVLTWALAMFVLSLEAPSSTPEDTSSGVQVFEQNCASCHIPEAGFSGGLIAAEALGSDPTSANSPFRGTGFYKIPSLLGISQGGPYLHDASVPTLRDLLDSGHPRDVELSEDEKVRLISYLNTL